MPEMDEMGRLPCPKCKDRPITTRKPLGESETTWCVSCGIAAKSASGDSVSAWNEMVGPQHEARPHTNRSDFPVG